MNTVVSKIRQTLADLVKRGAPGEGVLLVPVPRIGLRATIFVLLTALAFIGSAPWYGYVMSCLTTAGLLGTFPRVTVGKTRLEKQWFVFFFPVGVSRVPLAKLVQIETDVERRIGLFGGAIMSIFIGLGGMLFIWLLDWLLPWAGGDYKIWFRMHPDDRVLIWQGMGESNFHRNVETLEAICGMRVTRG